MKSGATESSFYYLSQYLNIPQEVHISRSSQELLSSSKKYKILWAHDNCDQPIHANLPEVVSQIDKIVCVSHWEREQYIKYNRAPAEKLIVIPNGVAEMFSPSGNPKSKTCIFFSAPHKGITPLPKIWKQVIKQHPDVILKVFSSGDLYSQYQNLPEFSQAIEELQSLPNVLYSSCIDREDLLAHIRDAAFFIHPNVWEETFCVSLAEAMCCGCYPITTDMGALSETSFGRGKYVPMSGENTSRGWVPNNTFISNFSQEVINALHFFDKDPETFYNATNELSILTRNTYDWKQISQEWSNLIEVVTKKAVFIDDAYIFNEVYTKNEYNIQNFSKDDIVIDIGAHKGYFAKLCMDKGCKHIHCFEPEPKNYEALINNLKDYKEFQPYNLAVLDKKGERELVTTQSYNTGLHSFYSCKGVPVKVQTIGLDDILVHFSKVSLIKIDTEGAEFEILYNSKLLDKVKKITGEYHNGITQHSFDELKKYLEEKNFQVKITKTFNENRGIFVADNLHTK